MTVDYTKELLQIKYAKTGCKEEYKENWPWNIKIEIVWNIENSDASETYCKRKWHKKGEKRLP